MEKKTVTQYFENGELVKEVVEFGVRSEQDYNYYKGTGGRVLRFTKPEFKNEFVANGFGLKTYSEEKLHLSDGLEEAIKELIQKEIEKDKEESKGFVYLRPSDSAELRVTDNSEYKMNVENFGAETCDERVERICRELGYWQNELKSIIESELRELKQGLTGEHEEE